MTARKAGRFREARLTQDSRAEYFSSWQNTLDCLQGCKEKACIAALARSSSKSRSTQIFWSQNGMRVVNLWADVSWDPIVCVVMKMRSYPSIAWQGLSYHWAYMALDTWCKRCIGQKHFLGEFSQWKECSCHCGDKWTHTCVPVCVYTPPQTKNGRQKAL